MAVFVRLSAAFVGVMNLAAYLFVGSSEALIGDDAGELLAWPYLLFLMLFSISVGLLIAEVLLRLLRPTLEGNFLRRYAAAVLGCCVGGILSVVLLTLIIVMYATLTSQDGVSLPTSLLLGAYFAIYAGLLGLAEGLFLGLPFAAISGRLRMPA